MGIKAHVLGDKALIKKIKRNLIAFLTLNKYLVRFCSCSMLIFSLEVSNVYRMPDVDARLIIIFQEACQDSRPRIRWS